MSEPAFVLDSDTVSSAEATRDLAEILSGGGFVLLPSDTAFSVAALPLSPQTPEIINAILRRPPMAISLAFPSVSAAQEWIVPDTVAHRLLERYCPGPITVVCRASPHGIPWQLLSKTIAARNRTIGVRIPNSAVERAVAAATSYPVTTVAVRDLTDNGVITDFAEAMTIVQSGLAGLENLRWCAIRGTPRYRQHSTVVEVAGDDVHLIREGDIAFDEIRRLVRDSGETARSGEVTPT